MRIGDYAYAERELSQPAQTKDLFDLDLKVNQLKLESSYMAPISNVNCTRACVSTEEPKAAFVVQLSVSKF